MKYFEFRFSWVPLTAFVLAALGYVLCATGLMGKENYIFIFGICAAMVVVGNVLMVFLPREKHKNYFRRAHKMMVAGFLLFAIYAALNIGGATSSLKELLYYLSLVLFILGIIGIRKKA